MFNVIIRQEVFSEDFKRIDRAGQLQILKAIRKKLTTHPDLYGKPLSRELKNCFKLKTGPFRIVYQIIKKKITVVVVAAGFRRDQEAYLAAARRMGLI